MKNSCKNPKNTSKRRVGYLTNIKINSMCHLRQFTVDRERERKHQSSSSNGIEYQDSLSGQAKAMGGGEHGMSKANDHSHTRFQLGHFRLFSWNVVVQHPTSCSYCYHNYRRVCYKCKQQQQQQQQRAMHVRTTQSSSQERGGELRLETTTINLYPILCVYRSIQDQSTPIWGRTY